MPAQRVEHYAVTDDRLVRTVKSRHGRIYVHRCTRRIFEDVCYAIEAQPTEGVTMETLAESIGVPYTQANVALEFLKERGCVVTRLHRSYPASGVLYEDAMCEFYALAEE